MGKRYRRSWWLLSFLATYLVQHLMLVGVTLPLYTVCVRVGGSFVWFFVWTVRMVVEQMWDTWVAKRL